MYKDLTQELVADLGNEMVQYHSIIEGLKSNKHNMKVNSARLYDISKTINELNLESLSQDINRELSIQECKIITLMSKVQLFQEELLLSIIKIENYLNYPNRSLESTLEVYNDIVDTVKSLNEKQKNTLKVFSHIQKEVLLDTNILYKYSKSLNAKKEFEFLTKDLIKINTYFESLYSIDIRLLMRHNFEKNVTSSWNKPSDNQYIELTS